MSFDSIKVVLVGESGIGKTSIIQQYAYKLFDQDCVSSISSQYISKVIQLEEINKSIRIEIWDTAGQERYRSMAKLFYKDAKVIILVYDITSKSSFEELKNFWIPEVKKNCIEDLILGLVANKADLYEIECVSDEEGINLAEEINAVFQKTSAKSGAGINNLFYNLCRTYLDPDYDYKEKDKIDLKKKKKKKLKEEEEKNKKDTQTNSSMSVKLSTIHFKRSKGCCG